jgi:hypothetical protein
MDINAGRMTAVKRKTMERVKDEEELTTKNVRLDREDGSLARQSGRHVWSRSTAWRRPVCTRA